MKSFLCCVWRADRLCVHRVQLAHLRDTSSGKPSAISPLLCYLKEVPPGGLGFVCDLISPSLTRQRGLYLRFPSLRMRAKVLGLAGSLGNQSRLRGICLSWPQRDWLGSGTSGALSGKWLLSVAFDQAVHGIFGRTRSDLSCTCVFIYSLKAELKH